MLCYANYQQRLLKCFLICYLISNACMFVSAKSEGTKNISKSKLGKTSSIHEIDNLIYDLKGTIGSRSKNSAQKIVHRSFHYKKGKKVFNPIILCIKVACTLFKPSTWVWIFEWAWICKMFLLEVSFYNKMFENESF